MHKSVFSSRVRAAGFPWGNETFMEIRDLSLIPTMRKKCDVKNPYSGSLNLSYNFIYSFQKTSCLLHPRVYVFYRFPGVRDYFAFYPPPLSGENTDRLI